MSVIFLNQPKISPHEVDAKYNARRIELIPQIEEYLFGSELFAGKDIAVTFSHAGVSSQVCILEVGNEKFVLKIPLAFKDYSPEAAFLRAWESVGVSVPHILEAGHIHGHPFTLMKYIEAETVGQTYFKENSPEPRIFVEMGKTLRQMHSTRAEKYGLGNTPEKLYPDFKTWIEQDILSPESRTYQKYIYIKKHNLLNEEHGDIYKAIDILIAHVAADPISTYCHYDFSSSNIFATKPLTVFDPDCMFNHPIIDVGRTILINISKHHTIPEVAEQVLEGYYGNEPYDRKAIQASILFNTYTKFEYWHGKQSPRIPDVQQYLKDNRHYLD